MKLIIILLTVLLFTLLSYTRPTSSYTKQPASSRQEHRPPFVQNSRSNAPSALQDLSHNTAETFLKRTTPGLPSLYPSKFQVKRMYLTLLSSMMPIDSASGFLQQFFSTISERAKYGGEWSMLPEKNEFSIEQGNFRLIFTCIGDTIPWSFVSEFALQLWKTAILGVTTLFETVYMDDAGKIGVMITLTLIENSSGSSNSPNYQDYREGSVPSITSP